MTHPTLHVTNWSSRKLHGPGRLLTIMARPRPWEHGVGRVPSCTPTAGALDRVRAGTMTIDDYRAHVERRVLDHPHGPGGLTAISDGDAPPVADGDTLCCACSRAEAAAGRCHRVWVAHLLARAGWRVVLDGVEVE